MIDTTSVMATKTSVLPPLVSCRIEVLIPDFDGSRPALNITVSARPDVLNHNIESPRRVFSRVRPRGDYDRSLELLARAKEMAPAIAERRRQPARSA